jgi:hypothetical protein
MQSQSSPRQSEFDYKVKVTMTIEKSDGSTETFKEFVGEAKGDMLTGVFIIENENVKLVCLPAGKRAASFTGKRKRSLQALYNL